MAREQKWELRYKVNGQEKVCYPRSEEKKNENLKLIEEKPEKFQLVSCKKMYPFDMWNNQHNFELISNICFNRMHDMMSGEIEFDQNEYDRLDALKEKADRLFGMMTGPVTWMVWDDLKDAKELSSMAVNHRIHACIENGRSDLVQYC